MSNKIALVVVIFNKTLEESATVRSLLSFEQGLNYLLIVNNGPKKIDQHDKNLTELRKKHHNVTLDNQIQNKPLSWIYNDFIQEYESDYYVIFDDDTEINTEYESQMFNMTGVDLELPKIISINDKVQYYPVVNSILQEKKGKIFDRKEVFSIGSGLIVSKVVKKIFLERKIEIFDSNFALYGVDFSFFRKLNKIQKNNIKFNISSNTYLNHSLSRAEKEISEWREKERLYDLVLTLKYYYSYAELRILKLLIKKILCGKVKDVLLILSTAINGAHPRCNKSRKDVY